MKDASTRDSSPLSSPFSECPFSGADGTPLWRYVWEPPAAPRGIFHIVHGLGGHALLYDEAARTIAARGYIVYANDHRGHGKTAGSIDRLGYFSDTGGWDKVVGDLGEMAADERDRYPGVPYFLLGQSMGAAVAAQALFQFGGLIDGCILAGSPGKPEAYAHAIRATALVQRALYGKRARSRLLHRASLAKANWRFRPVRTDFDWLSRDEAEVQRFVADPFCGFVGTTQLWVDLVDGVLKASHPGNQSQIRRDLPVYFISGTEDPVNNRCRRVELMITALRRNGHSSIESKFYPGARHDMLLETNRIEVCADLVAWMDRIGGTRRGDG